MVADSLSCQDQFIGSEWTLAQVVVDELGRRWPVLVVFFATSFNYLLTMLFSPLYVPMAVGPDAFLQSWGGFHDCVFPPFAVSRRSNRGTLLTLVAPLQPQMSG